MDTTSSASATPDTPATARVWSAYQLAVFRDIAEGRGHTFVSAVAGSGKSSTMEEGLTHVPVNMSVLVCAFNKEIDTAFKPRLARIAPRLARGVKVESSTLHGYGKRQLTRKFGRHDLNADKTWMLMDQISSSVNWSKSLKFALSKTVSLSKGTLARNLDDIKDLVLSFGIDIICDDDWSPTEEEYAEQLQWFAETVSNLLDRSKKLVNIIDFDDMIWLPVVLNIPCWQFDRVFIDETQDLNKAQVELALRACKQTGRILAVGDKHQAIYAFRGADELAIDNLVSRLRAKTMLLSVTYRCGKAVVREAQKVVPHIEHAPGAEEGKVESCSTDQMMKSVQEGDFVLSRSNAPLVGFCMKLLAQGRRAMIAGRSVGKNLESLILRAKTQDVGEMLVWVTKWSEREIMHLQASDRPKDDQIQAISDTADTISALSDNAQSVNEIIARITALFSDDRADTSRIVLSSTHKAKGLERDTVWLLKDTYMKRSETEESNLYYVAVTRAAKNLYLCHDVKKDGGV